MEGLGHAAPMDWPIIRSYAAWRWIAAYLLGYSALLSNRFESKVNVARSIFCMPRKDSFRTKSYPMADVLSGFDFHQAGGPRTLTTSCLDVVPTLKDANLATSNTERPLRTSSARGVPRKRPPEPGYGSARVLGDEHATRQIATRMAADRWALFFMHIPG